MGNKQKGPPSLQKQIFQEVKMALNSLGIGLEDFFWVSSHQGTGVKELKRDLQQRLVGMSRGAD